MSKISVVLLCFVIFFQTSSKRFELENLGFSFEEPEKWFKITDEKDFIENIKKHDWDDKQWDKIKASRKEVITAVVFYKYKKEEYKGVIPTVNLNLAQNSTKNLEQLKQLLLLYKRWLLMERKA